MTRIERACRLAVIVALAGLVSAVALPALATCELPDDPLQYEGTGAGGTGARDDQGSGTGGSGVHGEKVGSRIDLGGRETRQATRPRSKRWRCKAYQ